MVAFLAGGAAHEVAGGTGARRGGLAAIQGLGGDLAGVIDAHQPGRVSLFRLGQRGPRAATAAGARPAPGALTG
jgi:hypothetical protein